MTIVYIIFEVLSYCLPMFPLLVTKVGSGCSSMEKPQSENRQ